MKKHVMFVFGVLLLSMFMVNGVEAAEGEFMDDTLEDYKNTAEVTAEQVNRAESYMENGMFLDKYDYETNQFDCKWYEVMCQTNGFLFTTVSGFVFGAIDSFGKFQIDSSIITGNPIYEGYMLNFKSLAWTMTAIFLLWQTVKIVILYSSNGDEGMNTLYEKLIAVVTGSILLGIYGELFEWILEMTHLLTEMLLTSPVTHYKMMQVLAVNSVGYGIILMLVVSVILFVFFLSILYRTVLFVVLYITGVLAIPTIVNDQYNFFSLWLKIVISNVLTLTLQLLCFVLGVKTLVNMQNGNFLIGMIFFIIGLSIPALLNQFGASTGSAKAIGSTVKYVAKYVK
ncbi:conjugal transfer protein TrbL family protein [Paenisporosarcina sp. TG-14]|uniref:conjugal transfer protein TrbL family protein n=1 Tax=Paenisporosarcina sp. TG-14 TaxID=1231057 RepID=UPI0002EE8DB1|nr:conjugal transfer protein TrbL family protein [Paenisporosarcina sp. TG-14]